MVVSLVGMGIFMVFCSWGLLVGWGTKNLFGFLFSHEFPTFVLARHLWGGAWVLVLFALLNSALGVAVACNNVATRMWFSMARDGVLPRGLAVLHPRHRTPTRAIALQLFVVLFLGLGLGAWLGPFQAFQGEILSFVALHDVKESAVVGGAIGGNLPQNELDVARGGDRRAVRGVLRGISRIVALHGSPDGSAGGRAGREMQSHARVNFQRRAEFDRSRC